MSSVVLKYFWWKHSLMEMGVKTNLYLAEEDKIFWWNPTSSSQLYFYPSRKKVSKKMLLQAFLGFMT